MPTFHLIVDEAVHVNKFQCRVRVWRQAGLPPLVLSTQIRGQLPPNYCSAFRANFVLRSFLGYSLPVPVFFELSESKGQTRACRVRFEALKPKTPILRSATLRNEARCCQTVCDVRQDGLGIRPEARRWPIPIARVRTRCARMPSWYGRSGLWMPYDVTLPNRDVVSSENSSHH
jgi:hypothetical protein